MFGRNSRRSRSFRLWAFGLLLLSVGCSQGSSGGCSCAEPIPGGFPDAHKKKNVGQLKLTKKGFDFLEQNNQVIIQQFLPGGLTFDVPRSKSGSTEICTNPPCKVTGAIKSLNIDLVPTKTLRLNARLDISSTKIKIKQKILITSVSCDITATIRNKALRADITIGVDPRNQHLTFTVGKPSFSLSSSDFKVGGNLACKIVDLIKGLFTGLIEKEVQKAINGAIGDATCMTCKAQADCPSGASCSSGKCMQSGSCLPMPLGAEGQADLGSLLGTFGNATSKKLMFSVFVGARADVKTTGLELGTIGGTHADKHNCVPKKTFPALPTVPLFSFPTNAPDGKTYMLGGAFSQVMLDKASRDLYNSGMLCLKIDESLSPQIGGLLNVQGLGAIISPSLTKVVKNAPMYIGLRPSEPPQISVGKGTFKTNAKGEKEIDEPLLEIKIPKLGFDFYLLLHDRWIRLFTYRVDLTLPLGLEARPGGKLGLIMGDLNSALDNPSIENSYFLKEDPAKMATGLHSLIKTVIPLAAGSLGNQEFALPELQGFQITIRGITGQVPRTDLTNRYKFLGLFADLGVASPGQPQMPSFEIALEVPKVHVPKTFPTQLYKRQKITAYPYADIVIANHDPKLEYSFRINKGMWGPYSSKPRRLLESPQFLMQGRHIIYVQARYKDNPSAPLMAAGWAPVRVDYTPPKLAVRTLASGLVVTTNDNLTATSNIRLEVRIDQGAWLRINNGESLPTAGLDKANFEIRATDQHGNIKVTTHRWTAPKQTLPQPSVPTSSPAKVSPAPASPPVASSCQTLPFQPSLLGLFLLLGLAALTRRKSTS